MESKSYYFSFNFGEVAWKQVNAWRTSLWKLQV